MGGVALAGAVAADRLLGSPAVRALRASIEHAPEPVALVQCGTYEAKELRAALETGLRLAPPPDLRGRRVVFKPNFVEFDGERPINTDVRLIRECVRLAKDLGAKEVIVAEGPGHQGDTDDVWVRSGLYRASEEEGFSLVDLNYDDLEPRRMATYATEGVAPSRLQLMYLPRTILSADVLISLPKMKTHHWEACTLGMKSLFGVVPGAKYGWPKNILHHNIIARSIVELAANIPIHYTIVDGIVGMEGDGPINGTPIAANCLLFGKKVFDVDWVGAKLMGFDPSKIEYLRFAVFLGLGHAKDPALAGASLAEVRRNFSTLPSFDELKA